MFAFRMAMMVFFLTISTGLTVRGQSLLHVQQKTPDDLAALTASGVSVVAAFDKSFLIWGNIQTLETLLGGLDYQYALVDSDTVGFQYWIAGLRPGWTDALLSACGEIVWAEDNWILIRNRSQLGTPCVSSPYWMLSPMPLQPFAHPKAPPVEYAGFKDGQALAVKPLVEDMVADLTSQKALDHWNDVIDSAPTRYSTSAGCQTAAETLHDWFDGWGLDVAYQEHNENHAPNVIGTLIGKTEPEKVYIMIGHLDDLPSSGNAPGADDNASGSATVTALAEIMSGYGFAYTVKFVAVTGEEFGLYGSTAYAEDALSRGEDIQAVLNADMTGWEGDGNPNPENLDINYNGNSEWLGNIFAQAATDYQTGCVVDAFSCPGLTASDHAPFWSRGWSAICGITDNEGYCGHGGHYPFYHTSDDTLTNCGDTSFFVSAAKTYLATLAHLADPLCENPLPPTDVVANGDGDNRILVSWNSSGPQQIYEVFRAPGGCQNFDDAYKLAETDQLQWLDDQASGQITYGYFVFSKDSTATCRSHTFDCAEAITTGVCMEPPDFDATVDITNLQQTSCGIELNWSSATPRCGASVTYNVYRDQLPEFVPESSNLLATCVSATSYIDRAVHSNTVYYYVVRVEDDSGNGVGPCAGGNETYNTNAASGIATGPDTSMFFDNLESGPSAWTTQALPGDTGTNPWFVGDTASHSPTHAWFCADEEQVKDQVVVLAQGVTIPPNSQTILSFWHRVNTEYRWDGGVLEYSVDSGVTWHDILLGNGGLIPENPNRMIQGGYSAELRSSSNPLEERQAWTGDNSEFEEVIVDLTDFENHSFQIRWRMGCDSSVDAPGWWIDDIDIFHANTCLGGPCDLPLQYVGWKSQYSILDFVLCM